MNQKFLMLSAVAISGHQSVRMGEKFLPPDMFVMEQDVGEGISDNQKKLFANSHIQIGDNIEIIDSDARPGSNMNLQFAPDPDAEEDPELEGKDIEAEVGEQNKFGFKEIPVEDLVKNVNDMTAASELEAMGGEMQKPKTKVWQDGMLAQKVGLPYNGMDIQFMPNDAYYDGEPILEEKEEEAEALDNQSQFGVQAISSDDLIKHVNDLAAATALGDEIQKPKTKIWQDDSFAQRNSKPANNLDVQFVANDAFYDGDPVVEEKEAEQEVGEQNQFGLKAIPVDDLVKHVNDLAAASVLEDEMHKPKTKIWQDESFAQRLSKPISKTFLQFIPSDLYNDEDPVIEEKEAEKEVGEENKFGLKAVPVDDLVKHVNDLAAASELEALGGEKPRTKVWQDGSFAQRLSKPISNTFLQFTPSDTYNDEDAWFEEKEAEDQVGEQNKFGFKEIPVDDLVKNVNDLAAASEMEALGGELQKPKTKVWQDLAQKVIDPYNSMDIQTMPVDAYYDGEPVFEEKAEEAEALENQNKFNLKEIPVDDLVKHVNDLAAASELEALGGEMPKHQVWQSFSQDENKPESKMNLQLNSNDAGDFIQDEDLVEVMADEMETGKLNTEEGIENFLNEKQSSIVKQAKQRQADDKFVEESVSFIQMEINDKKEEDARREEMYEEKKRRDREEAEASKESKMAKEANMKKQQLAQLDLNRDFGIRSDQFMYDI